MPGDYVPRPGDIGLTRIEGALGVAVKWGQAMVDGYLSNWTHAFVVLDNGEIAEAQPGGVRVITLDEYRDREVIYSQFELSEAERLDIVRFARSKVGTPYSFLEYLYLVLNKFKRTPAWLVRLIEDENHLICSQFAALCYLKAGVPLFSDGDLDMDVTPGDIAYMIEHGLELA